MTRVEAYICFCYRRLILNPMTERDQLRAAARAAGLRVSLSELVRLLPAWRRYLALVEAMRREAITHDPDVW
jgi:hypothetical protein